VSRISVCIVCRNEADKLGACLESVGWADEVVVLDLSSEDGSADVARAHGAKVVVREPVPIVELARNEVAALAQNEWILAVDPDERVMPGLAAALRESVDDDSVDAVAIPFRHHDFGYPSSGPIHRFDPKIRLYRRSRVEWPTLPNELPDVPAERLRSLPARDDAVMIHDRNRTVLESLDRVLRYAPAEARMMLEQGETFTARRFVARIRDKTRKQVVAGRAFEDGVPGLLRAFTLVAFHVYAWAIFWELSGRGRVREDDEYLRRLAMPLRAASGAKRLLGAPRRLARSLRR
jgi:(heptosyl)LPS beta-1,4-glucosyltransferase